jgi:hypothetical protein
VLFPAITGEQILWGLGGGSVVAVAVAVASLFRRAPRAEPEVDRTLRPIWRMPPLTDLPAARLTRSTRIWMMVLRGYLVLAVGLVVVRVVQLALGG